MQDIKKISKNIDTLINSNAPKEHIDKYLELNGYNQESWKNEVGKYKDLSTPPTTYFLPEKKEYETLPTSDTDANTGSSLKRLAKGFVGGVASSVGTGITALKPIGQLLGKVLKREGTPVQSALELAGEAGMEYSKEAADYYYIPDRKFVDDLAAGFGSMATFLIPGFGVSKGVARLAITAPSIAKILGVATSTVLESMTNAGETYQEEFDKTKNPEIAYKKSMQRFLVDLPTTGILNKLEFLNELKLGNRIVNSFGTEGLQEYLQGVEGEVIGKDKPTLIGIWDAIKNVENFKAGLIGSITGGGTTVGFGIVQKFDNKIQQSKYEKILNETEEFLKNTEPMPQVLPDGQVIPEPIIEPNEEIRQEVLNNLDKEIVISIPEIEEQGLQVDTISNIDNQNINILTEEMPNPIEPIKPEIQLTQPINVDTDLDIIENNLNNIPEITLEKINEKVDNTVNNDLLFNFQPASESPKPEIIINSEPAVEIKSTPEIVQKKITIQLESVKYLPKPSNIADIPMNQVIIDTVKYQPRNKKLDDTWVQTIVDNFDPYKLTPIVVNKTARGYELLSGHHRYAALSKIQFETVTSIIYEVNEEIAMQIARESNIGVKEHSELELAGLFKKQMQEGLSVSEIGKKNGNKSSVYIRKYLYLSNLSPFMQDMVNLNMISIDMASTLGKAVETYGFDDGVQQEIFTKWIKIQDITPMELEQALKTLAPKIVEQMALGLPGVTVMRGFQDSLKQTLNIIKSVVRTKNRFNGILKEIKSAEKEKRDIPKELIDARKAIEEQVLIAQNQLLEIQKNIGINKNSFDKIDIVKESKIHYQKDIFGNWEEVKNIPKKRLSKEDSQPNLFQALANPKFEIPESAWIQKPVEQIQEQRKQMGLFENKEETNYPQKQDIRKKRLPDIIKESPITLKLIEDGFFNVIDTKINNSNEVANIFYFMKNNPYESAYILIKDENDIMLGISLVGIGSINMSIVNINKIISVSLNLGAKKICFIHNHPSGDIAASEQDKILMNKLKNACAIVGIDNDYNLIINDTHFGVIYDSLNTVKEKYEPINNRPYKVKIYNQELIGMKEVNVINNPENIVDYFKDIQNIQEDSIFIVPLDARNNTRGVFYIGKNLDFSKKVSPKILKYIVDTNSTGCILVSNNPNHILDKPDLKFIRKTLSDASIEIYDFVIIYEKSKYKSFLGEGLMASTDLEIDNMVKDSSFNKIPKLINSISKIRQEIGISEVEFSNLKNIILKTDNIYNVSEQDLIKFKRILLDMKTKEPGVPIKNKPVDINQNQLDKHELIKDLIDTPPISDAELQKIKNVLAEIHIIQKTYNITEEEAKNIKIDTIGWATLKNITNLKELKNVVDTIREYGKTKIERIAVLNFAISKGLAERTNKKVITYKLDNMCKHYFLKKFYELNYSELNEIRHNINNLVENWKGEIKIPRTTEAIRTPQDNYLMKRIQNSWVLDFLDPVKKLSILDVRNAVQNMRDIVKKLKNKKINKSEAAQLVADTIPMAKNDLRTFDLMGLSKDIGSVIQEGGQNYRKLLIKFNRIMENWTKVVYQTKIGNEVMFDAMDGPITQDIRDTLNTAQLHVIEDAKQVLVDIKEQLGLKQNQGPNYYIHHIIEDVYRDMLKAGFPIDSMISQLIEARVPKEVWIPALQKREGFPFVKRDFILVMNTYFNMISKRLAYQPILDNLKPKLRLLEKTSPDLAKYLDKFINYNLLGKHTPSNIKLAAFLTKISERFGNRLVEIPDNVSRLVETLPEDIKEKIINKDGKYYFTQQRLIWTPGKINGLISRLKMMNYLSTIAMSFTVTATNLTQYTQGIIRSKVPAHIKIAHAINSFVYTGTKMFNPKFWNFVRQEGILEENMRLLENDAKYSILFEKFSDFAFFNMKISEFVNRVGVAKIGGLQKRYFAKKGKVSEFELEKTIQLNPSFKKDANFLDKEFSQRINFLYGPEYTAPMFVNPLGRIAYHLNSFTTKYVGELIQFYYENKLSNVISNFNSQVNDESKIKYLNGLPPEQRCKFLFFMIAMSMLGYFVYNQPWRLSINSMSFNSNQILKIFYYLGTLQLSKAWKESGKAFMPFRSVYLQLKKMSEIGLFGVLRYERLPKENKTKLYSEKIYPDMKKIYKEKLY